MNEYEKEQTAMIQRVTVDKVDCHHCFYFNNNLNLCARYHIGIVNHQYACDHYLYDKKDLTYGK